MTPFVECRFVISTDSKCPSVSARARIEINQTGVVAQTKTKSGYKKPRVSRPGSAAGRAYSMHFSSRGRARQLRQLSCLYGAPLPMCWTDLVLNLPSEHVQRSITQAQWLKYHDQFKIRTFRRLLWSLLTENHGTVKKAATQPVDAVPTVSTSTMVQLRLPI